MSRSITELVPEVALEAQGAPNFAILQALSSTTRDFLTRSEAWRQWTNPIDLTLNQFSVVIPNILNDDTKKWQRMIRVAALKWEATGDLLEFRNTQQLQERDPLWRTRTDAVPCAYTQELTSTDNVLSVRIYPGASVATTGALRAQIVLTTHSYANIGANAYDSQDVSLPEFLFHQFRDTIVRGALARLLRMPNRDWTDKRQSAEYQAWFESDLIRAKSTADAEFGQPVLTVDYGGY